MSTGVLKRARHIAVCGALMFGTTMMIGCSALEVSDPTRIEAESRQNARGAADLWTIARVRFADAGSRIAMQSAILSGEFFTDAPLGSIERDAYLDRRESLLYESRLTGNNLGSGYSDLHQLRRDATIALPQVRAYGLPGAREAMLAELFALRGYSVLGLAENFCPGFPVRELNNLTPIYGPPLTTDQAFTQATADFDSALVYAVDSVRVRDLARLGKARALLGLGRFAEAGATAATVSPGYVASGVSTNFVFAFAFTFGSPFRVSVADRKGGTGLDYVSAADPRVVLTAMGHAHNGDTAVVLYSSTKYPGFYPSIVLANDVEARLIEAEAALNAHDDRWLTILNDLRAQQITPAMPALPLPTDFAAQVDLLFRERAFWLFATGHRLGDLRRLISHYGRSAETLFPTGPYRTGGSYGTATSLSFDPTNEKSYNPAVTGCTSR